MKRLVIRAIMVGAVLLFASACGTGGSSDEPAPPTDLTGIWNFHYTITAAGGVCSGDVGDVGDEIIVVTQTGSDLILSGFVGDPGNVLTGTVVVRDVNFSGVNAEDGGSTTTSYTGTATQNKMNLTETWSWTNGVNDCPGGQATILATRTAL